MPTSAPRILIVAPSWVGDAVLVEPLIALLKSQHPQAVIDVLAPNWCAPVYARMRHVQRILENPLPHGPLNWAKRKALAHSLRPTAYTHAYVLPNSWKSALIPYLANIPQRIGYTGEARIVLLNDRRRLYRKAFPRLVDRFAALAYPPYTEPTEIPTPLPVLQPHSDNQQAALAALHLDNTVPIAIFCPGAEYGPAKRWPAEHFAELAKRLMADGADVWLVGSPNDRPMAEQITALVGDTPHLRDIVGRTDLGTVVDLIAVARIVVSNDSGLMHIAAALDVPLVALFGSSSPDYTPPLSTHARIAKIDIKCSPCFKRECPLKHFKCMRDLTPDRVQEHIAALNGRPDA